jgi:predicted RNA-binding Zn-ribbon protein involved in translation (DUF1610 family)
MAQTKPCPECGSDKIYRYKKPIAAGGGYAPQLLPGISTFSAGKMLPIVCTNCGFVRFFAADETFAKIETSKHWHHI